MFLQYTAERVWELHTISTETTQMPLDPISNGLEAHIIVASKMREDLIFSCV